MADYHLRLELEVKVSTDAEEPDGRDEAQAALALEQNFGGPVSVTIGGQTFEARDPLLPDWHSDAVREHYGLPVPR